MTGCLRFLLRYLVCSLLLLPTAQALPVIGGPPVATVTLTSPHPALEEKLKARLKTYAESYIDKDGAADRRHARAEIRIIEKQLRAEGYYQARVQQLQPRHYQVEPGPLFTLQHWAIESSRSIDEPWPGLPLTSGQPLLARDVLTARDQLLAFLRTRCYPQAKVTYDVVLDAGQHSGQLTLLPEPGPRARIGALEFSGLEDLNPGFLQNLTGLEAGDCLRYAELDRARLALLQSGLLSAVSYSVDMPAAEPGQPVSAAVRFRTVERKSRSIKASVGYTTDAEEGVTLGWEHRNLFGDAERLEVEGGIDRISRTASARLTLPQFFHPSQELQLSADIDTEEPDAYTSRSKELAAILSREWSGGRRASIGVALTESRVEEEGDSERFSLLSLPVALGLDRRDDAVDTRSGWAVDLALRPFTDTGREELDFLQTATTLRAYLSQEQWLWQPTLALRASAGSLTGAPLESIPADQRFYVGGGGSVRGYPYQTVGELTDGEADGGKSFAEASLELRLHFSSDWGLVVFADGGYAYPKELPGFGEQFLWGAGLGLRYFTRFAPIRFDVAFPLNRREGVDNSFQLYVSFGQAF